MNAALFGESLGAVSARCMTNVHHCSAYAGFPKAVHAVFIFKEVHEEEDQGDVTMQKYETTTYEDILYVKYNKMAETVEEAKQQAEEVKRALCQPGIHKFLNDNSNIHSAAAPEVNEVWGELMSWVSDNIEKNATVAPNVMWKMQLNRLSKKAGAYEKVRAFTTLEDALQFMDVPEMKI